MTNITFIDLEINPTNRQILDIGAIRHDGASFHCNSPKDLMQFIAQTEYIGGHNILNHDLQYISPLFAQVGYKHPKVIDTLYLSPLLFPARPYHHLLKDDKLQTESLSNPLNDSIKAQELFLSEVEAFNCLDKDLKDIYFALLYHTKEFGYFFDYITYNYEKQQEDLDAIINRRFDGDLCKYAPLTNYINQSPVELAYCLALINCKDRYSITPPWVLHSHPKVESIMYALRNTPCLTGCDFCNQVFDAHKGLKTFFGFDSYRTYNNQSLQEDAVKAALKGKSLLAIFPTGGGKSITFQVPALMSGELVKGLTVVISPLQSLMKDQVDNLRKYSITDAVTINGLLDPIERSESFERVENGTASILYISPESLRSKSIERLLLGRKIVRFVIDEAHCFSSWGQDFRVDYLYIGDYIRQLQLKKGLVQPIPVSCFTATAKQEVIEDISIYFKEKLNIQLELFRSNSYRTNLEYQVFQKSQQEEKYTCLREIIELKKCPTIIYVARTRTASTLAARLKQDGFSVRAFHGKMDIKDKTENQNDFISGIVQIMVATSAFGMGVDKKDVGLVVHYEISDSLENYVQESGRAGRDENIEASCYILFDEEDLTKHFILLNQTKLHIGEIQQVWKAIKNNTRLRPTVSQSALEIARRAGWDENVTNIETRVTTAIAALEESGYLRRGQNIPRVFADSILANTVQEAIDKINLSPRFNEKQKTQAIRIIKKLISTKSRKYANDEAPEARIDYISDHLGIPNAEVIQITLLRDEKILADNQDLTAYIIKKEQRNRSLEITRLYNCLEDFLLTQFNEEEKLFNLKELREQAEIEIKKEISLDKLKTLINFWCEKNWIIRSHKDDNRNYRAIYRCSSSSTSFDKKTKDRHLLSEFIINYLYEKTESETGSAKRDEILVEFSVVELKESYEKQQVLFQELTTLEDIEDTLFYLSRIGALQIEGGFLVIYNRMTIKRLGDTNIRYKQDDYRKLEKFYSNKTQKIHIVGEYARKMSQNNQEAQRFVDDYFRLNNMSFIQKYFPGGRKEEISRRITPTKYKQLFGELSESQLNIINDNQPGHIVVAAGPGSGKTRLLVHKLASLLLMEDVKHEQLLMLTFSRAAASEFRKRLHDLIGNAVGYIEIKTFHSYCFDLLGKLGSIEKSESVIKDTIDKIKNDEVEISRITKSVLVIDEAQDMTEDEFNLITALIDKNETLKVIAVGDDDQNIYSFRKSDSKYMQYLISKYQARFYELYENFRSKSNLVTFANSFVNQIPHRMKHNPIVSHQPENGSLRITYYPSNNLIIPLIKDVVESPLAGTTGVLTKTNEEAVFISCLLQEQGIATKLVQTNSSNFYLGDLNEIRYFTQVLNLTKDTHIIDNERWEVAKRKLKYEFGNTSSWEICRSIILTFEQIYSRKYLSDWKTYLFESNLEDFYSAQGETVIVSTIHKAKGKEFDNVFLLLNNGNSLSDEKKREIYVAITRAKQNISIHLNGHYFNNIVNGLTEIRTDNNQYPIPQRLCYLLTHKDLNLDTFISSYCQAAIYNLKSGMPLQLKANGCTDFHGNEILRFSRKFQNTLEELDKKGYRLKEAAVNFVVYWERRKDKQEVKIVLPKIIVEKNTD